MHGKTCAMSGFLAGLALVMGASAAAGQPGAGGMKAAEAQALVDRTLANEIHAAETPGPLMIYRLRKSSPRLTTTKKIVETRDGDVARLLLVNDRPLGAVQEQQEETRLDTLLANPGRQRHRKQSEDADSARALKVLEALPHAFLYHYAGESEGAAGKIEKFAFESNPQFEPADLETEVLTEMAGQIWIDPAAGRVTHLEGQLRHDVDFGWGILGRLSKGGWISIDQADVGGGMWRIVRFQMAMTARVLFRTRSYDTVEVESNFKPLPAGTGYREGVRLLREDP